MGYKIKDNSDKTAAVDQVVALSSKEQFLFFVEEHRGLCGRHSFGCRIDWWSRDAQLAFQQKEEESWELQGRAQQIYLDRPLDNVEKGKNNVQQASGMFQDILEQYPGTPSAKVSLFLLGNSLMEAENYQGAIDAYANPGALPQKTKIVLY